jgi:Predicted ester cyclase
MTIEENKALVRRFVTEVFERGHLEAVEELVADDFVGHTWGNADKIGLQQAMERVAKGLADAVFTIEDLIAEDDRVVVRVTASARQVGEFMGMPPSGRSYTIGEIHIFRVRDGKIVEHWHQYDLPAMMRQLGEAP